MIGHDQADPNSCEPSNEESAMSECICSKISELITGEHKTPEVECSQPENNDTKESPNKLPPSSLFFCNAAIKQCHFTLGGFDSS